MTSQAQRDTKGNIEIANKVKISGEYMYVEASSDSLQNAINDAVEMLGRQIHTRVVIIVETETGKTNTNEVEIY